MNPVRQWIKERFADPQLVMLIVMVGVGAAVVLLAGDLLMPVFASLVIAYLLEGLVRMLRGFGVPRRLAAVLVFILFLVLVITGFLVLVPLLVQQVGDLINQIPSMVARGQEELLRLPERYPQIISEAQIREIMTSLRTDLVSLGQKALSASLASLRSLITFLIYSILMPLMVFFFLKDKERILNWARRFLPEHRTLATEVWEEVNHQTANYIRGKAWEILIVWGATYFAFLVLGVDFALLLGLLVGLSVIIPYVGATVVTIPVALVAYYEFGWSSQTAWVLGAYGLIQALDGNLLVPLLLSGVVDLHPVAIIVAILFFGGLWGFWGVFFAIPLATLVQAVVNSVLMRRATPPARD